MKEKKLTPEQEARRFDKRRFGGEAELTEEEREKQKEREENIKIGQQKAEEDRLKTVADFDSDPIGYLKMKLGEGNYEGRDKQYNYLLLTTLIRIQQALESFNLNSKSRK